MRKAMFVVLTMFLLWGMAGCAGEEDKDKPVPETKQETGKNTEQENKQENKKENKKDSRLLQSVTSEDFMQGNGSVMKTENGYYYYDVSEEALCYYDIATGKNMYLCNKPECRHDGNAFCVATNQTYAIQRIWLYSDRLYAAVVETTGTQYLLKVISIALDGSETREIATYMTVEKTGQYPVNDTDVRYLIVEQLGEDIVLTQDVSKLLIHRNRVVLPMCMVSREDFNDAKYYGTAILNLETEQVTYLNEEPLSRDNPKAEGFRAYGDYIYYYQKEGRKNILHRYHVTNGTDESYSLQPGFTGTYVVLDEDSIVYLRSAKNVLNVYHPSTKVNEQYDTGYEIAELMTDGTYLYITQEYRQRMYFHAETMETKEQEDLMLYVMSRELEEVAATDLLNVFSKEDFPEGKWYPEKLGDAICVIGEEIYFDLFQNRRMYHCKKSELLSGQPQVELLYQMAE